MAFVKLDCGMLDSTIWIDREARELFITALLMAEPYELDHAEPALRVTSLEHSGFIVPPGWYGFVAAAGPGIVNRAGMRAKEGIEALERLAEPEPESRTPDHEGRRMVRINGGYIVLNFDKYRQKDHTAAERSKRYRERKEASRVTNGASRVETTTVTQAEADSEVPKAKKSSGYAVPPCFEDVEGFSNALAGWIEVRNKKRNPPTGNAIQILINRLSQRPADAVSALEMAIESGWQTVKWPWFDRECQKNGSHFKPADTRPAAFRVPMKAAPTRPEGV